MYKGHPGSIDLENKINELLKSPPIITSENKKQCDNMTFQAKNIGNSNLFNY